jgi:lysophospholipase L1-like esterase
VIVSMVGVKTRVLALGDSITCGEGVGVRVHLAHTWAAVLAHALDADFELLAERGARTAQMRARQAPLAVAEPAELATVLIGLNDVSRTGWHAETVAEDLRATVWSLRSAGSTVLLARLHDPSDQLPLPRRLRTMTRERLNVINTVVDELVGPGVLLLDLAAVPELWRRSGWAVDRVHPSVLGHRGIAQAALRVLCEAGWQGPEQVSVPSAIAPCSRLAEARWLALHGAPFLVRNVTRRALVGDRRDVA